MSYGRDSFEDLTYNSSTDSYDPATGYGRNQQLDLVYNPETEEYERVYPDYCTLTINPTPLDARVTFNTGAIENNSTTVASGTEVIYTVTKQWYETVTDSVTLIQNRTINVDLVRQQGSITIHPTPSDATVHFDQGVQVGNTCLVDAGTSVTYTVSKVGYDSYTNTVFIENTAQDINVTLSEIICLITVIPAPSNSTVILTASGYSQVGNTITVPYGTTVNYTVSHEGYITVSSSFSALADRELIINLKPDLTVFYTVTVKPTPNDANVQIIAPGYTPVGNTIEVPAKTLIKCIVSARDYETKVVYISADRDMDYPVILDPLPLPENQIVFDTSLKCYLGQTVTYWVNKHHYIPVTGTTGVIRGPTTVVVPLLSENLGTVKQGEVIQSPTVDNKSVSSKVTEGSDLGGTRAINAATLQVVTDPVDAEVKLTSATATQEGNSITVLLGSQVFWSISKEHYLTSNGNLYVVGDQTILVKLSTIQHSVKITTISGGLIEIIQDSQVVASGIRTLITNLDENSQFIIRISAEGYETYESNPITVDQSMTFDIPLNPQIVMFNIQRRTPGSVISFNGEETTGNTIEAPVNTTVEWEVSAEGYESESGTHVMSLENTTEVVELTKKRCTYTIVADPNTAVINFTLLSGVEIDRTDNSITVEYGSVIKWLVNASGYVSQMANITVVDNETREIVLEPSQI